MLIVSTMLSKELKQKRNDLINELLKINPHDFLKQHSILMDNYFQESFEKSIVGPNLDIIKNPYAIVALGGYGRQELCVYSDIDILFIFKDNIPEQFKDFICEIIYPLWDIGLDVSHATRTISECLTLSNSDFEVLISLLDSRVICGMSLIYSNLMEEIRDSVLKQKNKIIDWIVEQSKERHSRFGDSAYLLEPNLKEGQGGLRDYHNLLWIAKIKSEVNELHDLKYYGYLSETEHESIKESLSFIFRLRNHLHYLTNRKCDTLHFEYQIKLANLLNFNEGVGQEPVEKFLSELHFHMEFIKQRYISLLYESGYTKNRRFKKNWYYKTNTLGIKITKKKMLNFRSPEDILENPILLLKIFEESCILKIPICAEAKRLINEFGYLINDNILPNADVFDSFEKILTSSRFNVLNEMLYTGMLTRLIPEFKTIENRIQYNEYHIYPVGKHLLYTVGTIKKFSLSKNDKDILYHVLYKNLKNKKLLMLAALLHDIGKGQGGKEHAIKGADLAKEILLLKNLKPNELETLYFLIKEHLFLIKTATRRDLNDEETAILCARHIKDTENLKMLYLLTVADSISTGPKAWNEWIGALLRDLFLKILNILERGELATNMAALIVEQKREELGGLCDNLSQRYLLYTSTPDIIKHINLYKSIGETEFVWNIEKSIDLKNRNVTICAKDCPGLFSKISGAFTLNNINILNAQIHTWKNNIALDIFNVTPPLDKIFEQETWGKVKQSLLSALSGSLNLGDALAERMIRHKLPHTIERPHKILIDNTSSSFFTIIEVTTYDFPGLLFCITDAMFRCKLDIWVAKIATEVDQVVDVFYVRDIYGEKIEDENHLKIVKQTIEEALKVKEI
ncbi:MAG: [protein-PII] uridylyltransferase [Desulfobacterales bacterium]|nr:[protein-PII] uridylyltransferase [Desulfobacterales bacterium]MBF0395210.1 [protein-PII] uridylyltransferase [Desulfobacterales bacterium]